MGNGFRRIALAQGLLPPVSTPEASPAWTDAVLAALLQIDEAEPLHTSSASAMALPDPALTARRPAAANGLRGHEQI